jgi:hypothetical protein
MSSNKPLLFGALLALSLPAVAAEDLRALDVQGQRGQSLEQARRDRYECHNWAVEQTGEAPPATPARDEPRGGKRELRRERIDRAIVGAAIGGAVGSLFGNGWRRHSGDRVLAGAAAGAAIGAATAGSGREEDASAETEPSDYLRALTACLEGRGYSVSLPTAAELGAGSGRRRPLLNSSAAG